MKILISNKKLILGTMLGTIALGGSLILREPTQEVVKAPMSKPVQAAEALPSEPMQKPENLVDEASTLNDQIAQTEAKITKVAQELELARLYLEERSAVLDRLDELESDYDDGLISDLDYQERRFELLHDLL